MTVAEQGHALPGALRTITVRMPGDPALAPAQELADQFRAGVLGYCALAGALIAAGWCVGLWRRFASQGLRRAMALLRAVGLVAFVLLVAITVFLPAQRGRARLLGLNPAVHEIRCRAEPPQGYRADLVFADGHEVVVTAEENVHGLRMALGYCGDGPELFHALLLEARALIRRYHQ